MDPYQSCPCGSGKGFKWCCQAIYPQVEKARQQHAEGQHEAALRTIRQLVAQHPGSAPALGYEAELLYAEGRAEEADDALQKAFTINPDFPFGHWLRGMIRRDEGEAVGALIEFRKAAEAYDPKAAEILTEVHAAIFDVEMRFNRPVAARAALDKAIHEAPAAQELRQAFDNLYGPDSRLPESARKAYSFRPAIPARAEAWKAALPDAGHSRFGAASAAFEKLTAEDANDAAAWFNLGLVRAWTGENAKAVEALARAVELENDPTLNAETGALIEVLRCGLGMEEQSDYVEHRVFLQLQQPQPVIQMLQEWSQQARLTGAQSDPENGTLSALVLEEASQFAVAPAAPTAKLAAYLLIVSNIMRLWHPNKEAVTRVADEVVRKVGGAVSAPMHETGPSTFSDVAVEAMLFPTRESGIGEVEAKMKEHAQSYFEDVWIHRPLKSLGGVPPIDAAGHPAYQKWLLGVVRFVEECFRSTTPRVQEGDAVKAIELYDFDRLRRKLGLADGGPAVPAESGPDLEALSAAELAGVNVEALTDEQLARAFRAALKLDARDVAGKFAQHLTGRPASAALPDRYPFFNHLIQLAQVDNDPERILAILDAAERADAEGNEGRRQPDYALRRGLTLARRGEADKAHIIFTELLAKHPDELRLYGPATEAMLGQKKGQWALEFAEQGLAKARAQNNRDSEQYFLELAAAARKQVG
jgi:tetratricopeptide (TPR) repeat protein